MEHGISVEQEMKALPAYSAEVIRFSRIGSAFARSLEASGTASAASALACFKEFNRLAGVGTAFARAVEVSGMASVAFARVRTEELNRLAGVGASFARAVEASGMASVASARVRTEELNRLVGVGSAFARSVEAFESATGFSHLSQLSHVVHAEEPFSRIVGELINDEFGDVSTPDLNNSADERDEAAIQAGLNPELIAFPHTTYEKVLIHAGFKLSIATVPVPDAIEEADACADFNPQHWQILNELEQRLRQNVEQNLKQLSGSSWIRQRVPQAVRERWLARQEEDRAAGRPVYEAIQYADFMDLIVLITRSDNWREIFQPIFRDKDDIAVSLRRLHPVRKALAHSRPLGRTDVLTLVSEAIRLFRALGLRVLH
ncbi:MAG: Swt1 family HEPN domain-containing protein [Gammaproteobacteria bacterium]|nr:Swt1 family HEPN domain-containing protein [Gammaproteobacteria bacterium]